MNIVSCNKFQNIKTVKIFHKEVFTFFNSFYDTPTARGDSTSRSTIDIQDYEWLQDSDEDDT